MSAGQGGAHARAEPPLTVEVRAYTLHPGDVVCAERGERMETLLGSCVAIILADPRRTTGAMCHVVHARTPSPPARGDTTFGDVALRRMYAGLRARAIEPRLCDAFVYGGGNMFPQLYPGAIHIGEQNARWASEALARDGIRVIRSDLGGTTYRRLSWTVGPQLPHVVAVQI